MQGYTHLAVQQLKGNCPQCGETKGNDIMVKESSVTDDLQGLEFHITCNHCGCLSILIVNTIAGTTQYKFI